jgi:hypothetical protein
MYKIMLYEERKLTKPNTAYVIVYVKDNGEGMDTEQCMGVFSKRSLALQSIININRKNQKLLLSSFRVEEFNVPNSIMPNDTVHVVHYDEEAHCEISTRIVDIQLGNMKPSNAQHYIEEYKVDEI